MEVRERIRHQVWMGTEMLQNLPREGRRKEKGECVNPGGFQRCLFHTKVSTAEAAGLCNAAFGWQAWPLLGMLSDG